MYMDIFSQQLLPETSKATALYFTQRTATTNECDRTGSCHRGQDLEQVPGSVVEEENTLDSGQGGKEDGVRNRSGLESSREVVEVDAEEEPLEAISYLVHADSTSCVYSYQASENRESSENSTDKSEGDDDGRVGRVILKGVVDLWELSISGGLRGGNGDVDITFNSELENGVIVGIRAAKSTNDNASVDGLGESEELEGEFLLGLIMMQLALVRRGELRAAGAIPIPREICHSPSQ